MKMYEVNGTYGNNLTPCTVFVGEKRNGEKWYVCEGSANVNCTYDDIEDGIDVEDLQDHDIFTWQSGINSLEELEAAIEA